ncbi:YbjN domain-containing protein [Solirubrobacter soli]|uniref:YbjN domain-containing protein n=1 Tax=Solirubrobacter soli TaxID=363832 RepID=UPI000400F8CC|nr:YbjN domain-containing protein [Solirubrobacter soli]
MPPEFDTPAHEEIYQVVEDYLVALDLPYHKRSEHTMFSLALARDMAVHVIVTGWGDDDAMIIVRAWIVRPETLSAELLLYLLERNCAPRLGALAVDPDGDVMFQYVLGGAELDSGELRDAVYAVQLGGARARDRILSRFAGRPL